MRSRMAPHLAALPMAYGPASRMPGGMAFPADRFDATFDGSFDEQDFDDAPDAIDRLPAWLAGGIVVGLSSVFWVGLLTIAGWII